MVRNRHMTDNERAKHDWFLHQHQIITNARINERRAAIVHAATKKDRHRGVIGRMLNALRRLKEKSKNG